AARPYAAAVPGRPAVGLGGDRGPLLREAPRHEAASFAARQQHRDPGGARRLRPGARWAPRPRRPRRR
ncbi:unnamed protein product, partial [Prorocentrum cordatum]